MRCVVPKNFGIMPNNTSLSKFIKTTDTSTRNNILNKLKDIYPK